MSTESLDNDALATEEMLKMFESAVGETDTTNTTATDDTPLEHLELADIDALAIDNDVVAIDNDVVAQTSHPVDDELPEMTESNVTDVDILEVADDANAALSELSIQDHESTTPLEINETSIDAASETMLEDIESTEMMPAEMPAEEMEMMALINEDNQTESPETTEAATELNDSTDIAEVAMIDDKPTAQAPVSDNIAEHLHAVVANAIQALQDWLELRQQGEAKGPQQNLAQLDVLLDAVTHQQQHLAEQLNNTKYEEINNIAQALGTTLATPETLGWSADTWRSKASEVAQKTDDISARNARLRQQLAQL